MLQRKKNKWKNRICIVTTNAVIKNKTRKETLSDISDMTAIVIMKIVGVKTKSNGGWATRRQAYLTSLESCYTRYEADRRRYWQRFGYCTQVRLYIEYSMPGTVPKHGFDISGSLYSFTPARRCGYACSFQVRAGQLLYARRLFSCVEVLNRATSSRVHDILETMWCKVILSV